MGHKTEIPVTWLGMVWGMVWAWLGHGWGKRHGWVKVGARLRHGLSKVATISFEIFFQIMK